MANLVYSPKDILQQEFKTKMRGYDPVEVDEFLDNIIKDYETYSKELLVIELLLHSIDRFLLVKQGVLCCKFHNL